MTKYSVSLVLSSSLDDGLIPCGYQISSTAIVFLSLLSFFLFLFFFFFPSSLASSHRPR